jgi:hypothetical protein
MEKILTHVEIEALFRASQKSQILVRTSWASICA